MRTFLSVLVSLGFSVFAQGSDLIYAVSEREGSLEVYINTLQVWKVEKRLTDSYSEEDQALVDDVTNIANLCNLMESTYEPCQPISKKDLIAKLEALKSKGLKFDDGFQKFINRENGAPVIVAGKSYESHTPLYKALCDLLETYGVPTDFLGERKLTDENVAELKAFFGTLPLSTVTSLKDMAFKKQLSDYRSPIFAKSVEHLRESILSENYEAALLEL